MRRVLYAIGLVLLSLGCGGGGVSAPGGGTIGSGVGYELRWIGGGGPSNMVYGTMYELELYLDGNLVPDPFILTVDTTGGPLRTTPTVNGQWLFSLFPSVTTGRLLVKLDDPNNDPIINIPVTISPGPVYEAHVVVTGPNGQPLPQVLVSFRFDNLLGTVDQQWTETFTNGTLDFVLPQNAAHMFVYYWGIYNTATVNGVPHDISQNPYIPISPGAPGTQQAINIQLTP